MHKCPEGTHHCFSLGGGSGGGATTVFCPVCFLCVFKSYFCDRKNICRYKNVFSCLRSHLNENTLCKLKCKCVIWAHNQAGENNPRLPWIIARLDTSGIQSHAAQTAGVTSGTHRAIQKAASWKKGKIKLFGWETEKQWGPSFSNVYLIWFHHALIWVNHPIEEVSRELEKGLRTLPTETAATPPPPLLRGSKLPRRLCRDTERGRIAAQAHMRDSIKQSKNR